MEIGEFKIYTENIILITVYPNLDDKTSDINILSNSYIYKIVPINTF